MQLIPKFETRNNQKLQWRATSPLRRQQQQQQLQQQQQQRLEQHRQPTAAAAATTGSDSDRRRSNNCSRRLLCAWLELITLRHFGQHPFESFGLLVEWQQHQQQQRCPHHLSMQSVQQSGCSRRSWFAATVGTGHRGLTQWSWQQPSNGQCHVWGCT